MRKTNDKTFYSPKFKLNQTVWSVFCSVIIKGQIEAFDIYTGKYMVFFNDDVGTEWCTEEELCGQKKEAVLKVKRMQHCKGE